MNFVFVAIVVVMFAAKGDGCERHEVKCPDYTVIQANKEYEERQYPSLVWISSSENGKSKSDVSRKLIKQLYNYLGGENDKRMSLNMTVPVRTTKMSHEGYNTYTMAIALTLQQSENPPQPDNPLVTVNREPAAIYVVRSFDGYARQESIWDDHAAALKASILPDNAVNTSFYYMCVYDSPWRETDRLNEIWMVKAQS